MKSFPPLFKHSSLFSLFTSLLFPLLLSCGDTDDRGSSVNDAPSADTIPTQDSASRTALDDAFKLDILFLSKKSFDTLAPERGNKHLKVVFEILYEQQKFKFVGWAGKNDTNYDSARKVIVENSIKSDIDIRTNPVIFGSQKLSRIELKKITAKIDEHAGIYFVPKIREDKMLYYEIRYYDAKKQDESLAPIAKTNPSPPASAKVTSDANN